MARAAKRARQKEGRRQRIEAEVKSYRARRRRQLLIGIGVLVVFAGVVAGSVYTQGRPEPKATPKATGCSTKVPAKGSPVMQTTPPPITLDPAKTYVARIETSCGIIEAELAKDTSPNTVNSFAHLANQGFFNGLTFHRIVKGFVVQGGDPAGNGSGGPGYQVVDVPPVEFKYPRGTLAMAKTGTDPAGTAGSQFFIVTGDQPPALAGTAENPAQYAVLGKVIKGLEVLSKLDAIPTARGPSGEQSSPSQPVYIVRITIVAT